ncbi:MAG: ABC transporter ATP-binding protein [Lachnospiraceae bacterium]
MSTVIQAHNLTKSYGSISAVNNVSLSVSHGEIFGLLGENGAGKSTVVECILGTRKPDSGTISILGKNPVIQRKELFEQVGVQFQESHYQEKITVSELCEETQCLYNSFIPFQSLLKTFGLTDKANAAVQELSGGQKQRLFIVLALIPEPKVIFLDELTTGLDTKARREVWNYLIQLKKNGLTIFLTSHFMDEVEVLCDRIGILKHGSMVYYGTPSEAIQSSTCKTLEDAYLWYTNEEDTGYENF